MESRGHRVVVSVLGGLAVGGAAWAVSPPAADFRQVRPALAADRALDVTPATSPEAAALVERSGGAWRFRRDPRTGRFAMVSGSGVPLIPGRGNDLQRGESPVTLQVVEPLAREFVDRQRELIAPTRGALVLNEGASAVRDRGNLISVVYDWQIDGVPVEGAMVFVRLRHGNVTQFGSRFVGDLEAETTPRIGALEAREILLSETGAAATAVPLAGPELLLQVEEDGGALALRLAWRFRYTVPGRIETWEGRVDAATGRVVGFRDINQYLGQVRGGIHARNPRLGSERRVGMQSVAVSGGRVSDLGGHFDYTGGSASSNLGGRYFAINCVGCTNQPFVSTAFGTGRLDFGVGGNNVSGNGMSTPAGRSTFYHLNRVRAVALKWLPTTPWLLATGFDANVNIGAACNAFYNVAAVNFDRESAACISTGQSADVIYHEWGHGLDFNTLSADGSTGEGVADVTALMMSHDPLVGRQFWTGGAPVRWLDWRTSPRGLMTLARVQAGDCNILAGGALSPHCAGEVFGQTAYDLVLALIDKYGHHTGWRTAERLFFASQPDQGSQDPATSAPVYDAFLQADDDDGNLANGTPNAAEIHEAFDRHGIANAARPSTPSCTRPAQSIPTVAALCDRVELSWDPVPGADRYEILRADVLSDIATVPVGEVDGSTTQFVDDQVTAGIDYRYTVMTVDAAGCESAVEQPVFARLPDRPFLEVTDFVIDDAAHGNATGIVDPGERIDITLTLTNNSLTVANDVSGVLDALEPGVTLVQATSDYPNLGAGASAPNEQTLTFETDAALPCGSVITLALTPADSGGCASDVSFVTVVLGQFDGQGWVCNDPTPCNEAPSFAGLSTATPGPSCGQVDLGWPAASIGCSGDVTYNVYRSTAGNFIPSEDNRLATGLDATTLSDVVPSPGSTYHYIVRAVHPVGGEDANEVRLAVVSPNGPDDEPPPFGGIGFAISWLNCGEVRLGWTPAGADGCNDPVTYHVYRSADPGFVPGPEHLVAATPLTDYVDAAVPTGAPVTYVVRATDRIGNEDSNSTPLTTSPGSPGGCTGCPEPAPPVGTIALSRLGNGVLIDWTDDPTAATRYVIHELRGVDLSTPLRIGTTQVRQFVHEDALSRPGPIYYRVSAVDACGAESALD